ncbi:MAG TPA: hypothetical protein VHD33_04550, partial [Legionellaceae bacterium]|nr:hypothetical protein [Legionellaceae bacterium]
DFLKHLDKATAYEAAFQLYLRALHILENPIKVDSIYDATQQLLLNHVDNYRLYDELINTRIDSINSRIDSVTPKWRLLRISCILLMLTRCYTTENEIEFYWNTIGNLLTETQQYFPQSEKINVALIEFTRFTELYQGIERITHLGHFLMGNNFLEKQRTEQHCSMSIRSTQVSPMIMTSHAVSRINSCPNSRVISRMPSNEDDDHVTRSQPPAPHQSVQQQERPYRMNPSSGRCSPVVYSPCFFTGRVYYAFPVAATTTLPPQDSQSSFILDT